MIVQSIRRLFGGRAEKRTSPARSRLFFGDRPDFIYAVGDVHGQMGLLKKLEEQIELDACTAGGTSWLVMLGDYVDRGPNSAAVLDRLLSKPTGAIERRLCLAGNHEEVMLDFIRRPSADHRWLDFGGLETLSSYGVYDIPTNRLRLQGIVQSHIPDDHIALLESLPSLMSVPGYCFVHAGIDSRVALADQDDGTLLWSRPSSDAPEQRGFTVVHGHTPVKAVTHENNRINVDTGAYKSGILSAVRIARNNEVSVIQAL